MDTWIIDDQSDDTPSTPSPIPSMPSISCMVAFNARHSPSLKWKYLHRANVASQFWIQKVLLPAYFEMWSRLHYKIRTEKVRNVAAKKAWNKSHPPFLRVHHFDYLACRGCLSPIFCTKLKLASKVGAETPQNGRAVVELGDGPFFFK